MKRVVITGLGVRSALGNTPAALHHALLEGQSAVRRMHEWDAYPDLRIRVGAPMDGFSPKEIPRKLRRTMGRVAMLGAAAARDAVHDAGIDELQRASGEVAVVMGSTMGSASAEEEFWSVHLGLTGSTQAKAGTFFQVMAHTVAANAAMFLGITGEALSTNGACASATQAFGTALSMARQDRARAVLCGGADELHVSAALTFDGLAGASRQYNDRPSLTPRPFDRARDGIVVGEGAGIAVFEQRASARARGAAMLAEVLGYGATTAGINMASPQIEGMEAAMRKALADARLRPDDIDFVNAHATGTPLGDAAEAAAIHRVFGSSVPVASWKGHLGHTLAACGGLELATLVQILATGHIPPTSNLDDPDVEPIWLPTQPLSRPCRHVLSANFAFGGLNTALVLGSPDLAMAG